MEVYRGYEAVIGLEVHAELQTQSKMFCGCSVVDSTQSPPNIAVCPVCAGMPGVLPVINYQAVEFGIRVGLALECQIAPTSIFARKNYFYPDLPKGYQISQFEYPLASNGRLSIPTSQGERIIRICRAHLEEDAGKLTHIHQADQAYSLVDLNRAGVPLLEIVSEPDMHTPEEARAYGMALRSLLRYLKVNSGDMEKGVIRFEANTSVRPVGSTELNTRTEVKNLNSFRALERSVLYEFHRQVDLVLAGGVVRQETLGWDDQREETFSQRGKEEAHDYRYFPDPDLPPLVVESEWVKRIWSNLPELPQAKARRFTESFGLSLYDADLLVLEPAVADYFDDAVDLADGIAPKMIANWITGELFSLMNQNGTDPANIEAIQVSPQALVDLLRRVSLGEVNNNTAKTVLAEMFASGKSSADIISERGLGQVSDNGLISQMIQKVLQDNPQEVTSYLEGKETVATWFFGQVMRAARGQANPQVVRAELEKQLKAAKDSQA
jgi:aspartyl-tRNA(Asn)/glutamyl-tRNA(Gln) amidotransferase subunit B